MEKEEQDSRLRISNLQALLMLNIINHQDNGTTDQEVIKALSSIMQDWSYDLLKKQWNR